MQILRLVVGSDRYHFSCFVGIFNYFNRTFGLRRWECRVKLPFNAAFEAMKLK